MLSCGLFFFFGRDLLIGLFATDPEVLQTGAMLLVFAAVYQFFDAMYIIYNGALRGAGDTLVPALATGGALLGHHRLRRLAASPSTGVTGTRGRPGPGSRATVYGVVLGLFMYARFRKGAGSGGRRSTWRTAAAPIRVPGLEAVQSLLSGPMCQCRLPCLQDRVRQMQDFQPRGVLREGRAGKPALHTVEN